MPLNEDSHVGDLQLPTRVQTVLRREQIWTIGLLLQALDDLPYFRDLGEWGVQKVRDALAEHGFL